MARIRQTREYEGRTADQGYAAAEKAFSNAGFEIWKRRPLGWLLMAKREGPKGTIQANVACRPGRRAIVLLTLESDHDSEPELHDLAKEILSEVNSQLQAP